MSCLTNNIDALNETLTYGLIGILADALTLVGIVIILLTLHLPLALLTLLVLPLLIGAFLVFRGPMRELYRDVRVKLARVNAHLQENLSGMRVVQLLCREPLNLEHFRRFNAEQMEAQLRSIWYQALFTPVIGAITSIGIALILWRGGGWALEGSLTIRDTPPPSSPGRSPACGGVPACVICLCAGGSGAARCLVHSAPRGAIGVGRTDGSR
jgi:ATP-binding cassette subfamily B multidrug efflux pump